MRKAPIIWTSEKRKALFEKEQKYGLSKKVLESIKKGQEQTAKLEAFFKNLEENP